MDNLQQNVDLGKNIKDKSEEVFTKVMNDCLFNNFQNIENTINLIKKQFEEIKNNFLNELKSNIEQWEKTKEIYNKKEKNLLIQNISSFQIFQTKLMENKNNKIEKKEEESEKKVEEKLIKAIKNEEKKEEIIKEEKKEEETDRKREFERKIKEKLKPKTTEEIILEIKKNLSNEDNDKFQPPMIEKNQLSISNELNEGIMQEDSKDSSNFEFLRLDLEVYLNPIKGQIFDDEDNIFLLESMKKDILNNIKNEIISKEDSKDKDESRKSVSIPVYLVKDQLMSNENNLKNEENKIKIIYQKYKNKCEKSELESLVKNLDYKERNLIELSCFYPNTKYYNVYNIILNTKEKIDLDQKLPLLFSYINIPPYSYISGGKDSNSKELKSIIRIQRIGENNSEYKQIGNLIKERSNHTSIYVPFINSIVFISGSFTKLCEAFNLSENKCKKIGDLHIEREGATPCLINESILYVFFGYNAKKEKYITSIEKIDLKKGNNKWEEIKFKITSTNMNLFQKQSMSSIPYSIQGKNGILLIGGIGTNGLESKEVLFYSDNAKSINPFMTLNFASSYRHQSFINYGFDYNDELYNLSNFGILVRFNPKNEIFTPIII